jgi:hypothetical protein
MGVDTLLVQLALRRSHSESELQHAIDLERQSVSGTRQAARLTNSVLLPDRGPLHQAARTCVLYRSWCELPAYKVGCNKPSMATRAGTRVS